MRSCGAYGAQPSDERDPRESTRSDTMRVRDVLSVSALTFSAAAALLNAGVAFAAVEEIPITTRSDDARADFIAAQAALDRGDGPVANTLLREAVAKDPRFVYAWINLGVASFSPEEFAETVKRAAAAASGVSEGEQLLAEISERFLDNDFAAQLATAKKLTDRYPNSPRAWLNLAFVQAGLNQFAEQRASLQRAIDLDASFVPAHLAMANSYLFNAPRDLGRAEKYFRQTIALAPGEDNYLWSLGDVYRAGNQLEKAREQYRRATLLDPNDSTSPLKLGHVNSFLGRYDEARANYDRGIANASPAARPFNANYRIFTWVHAGDAATAIHELESLATQIDTMGLAENQRTGAEAFTLTNALTVALHHNRHDDAARLLGELAAVLRANSKAVGSDDFSRIQEANIAYFEGQLAARRGDYPEATRLAEKNAELVAAQDNPRKMENYHDLMGLIALLQGRYVQAVEHYRQADVTNNIYVKYHLALALDGAKQRDEARRLFREVGQWNFNTAGFALVRKDALARAG
jgi:tetratricopeptide (TPR) repeat protein